MSVTPGVRRVQRVPESWPVVHLEAEAPRWEGLVVDGLVRHPTVLTLDDLRGLGAERRSISLHCVWGWSRPETLWDGVDLGRLLDLVEPHGDHVTVMSASDTYSSCLPLPDAAAGMLAWAKDGELLTPDTGGPLRFVGPPWYWAYKGVKWAARVTVGERFEAGFWESKVADPVGLIPPEVELP